MNYVQMGRHNAMQRQGKAVKLAESSAVHFSAS